MKSSLDFLIIEEKKGKNHQDLVNTIEGLGHTAHCFRLEDLVLQTTQNGLSASFGGKNFSEFDIVMPRTVSSNLRLGRLLLRLKEKNQFILDHVISKRDTFGKISQAHTLLSIGIHHPKTLYTKNFDSFKQEIRNFTFPCIAKPVVGSQGRGVVFIKNALAAIRFFQSLNEDYLFQEYLPLKADYRVFVIDKKILGTMKRFVLENDVRSNASRGAKTEPAVTTPLMKKIALQATAAFKYDIAGVDIAIVGKKHYVLEVNRTPQWQGIKNTLKLDPARAIVEFCIHKHALLQKKSS